MIIPHERLSPLALRRLIEEFVTRDGTDSGYARKSLETDVKMVMGQLQRGEAVIVYDVRQHSVSIQTRASLPPGPP